MKPSFWGVWGKPPFLLFAFLHLGSASTLMIERMLPIVHIWYIAMQFRK